MIPTAAPAALDREAQLLASFHRWLLTQHQPITADDARDWCDALMLEGAQIGAIFQHAARAGLVFPIGWQSSRVPSNHGRVVRVWEVVR